MKLRTVPMVMAISISSLGLIGVGVHATFTTSTSSGQAITAGTPDPTLVGSCVNGTNCPVDGNNILYTLSPDGETLTFSPDTPLGLSFTTGDELVTATNTGNLPLTEPTWTPSATVGSPCSILRIVGTVIPIRRASPFRVQRRSSRLAWICLPSRSSASIVRGE